LTNPLSSGKLLFSKKHRQTQKKQRMKNTKEIKYYAFDSKGNVQQSYSSLLQGASNWAIDCARRVNGYVTEVSFNGISESSEKIIFDLRGK